MDRGCIPVMVLLYIQSAGWSGAAGTVWPVGSSESDLLLEPSGTDSPPTGHNRRPISAPLLSTFSLWVHFIAMATN